MTAQKCDGHSGVIEAIDTLKKSDSKQWDVIQKIQNRPPVWITLIYSGAFSFSLLIIGLLVGYIKAKGA